MIIKATTTIDFPKHEHTDACGEGCSHEPEGPKPIDLGLTDKAGKPLKSERAVGAKIKSILGVSVAQVRNYLREHVVSNVQSICVDIISIAPYNKYANLLDETPAIENFFKGEMNKPKNWALKSVSSIVKEDTPMVVFNFDNLSADDGTIVKGYVFVDKDGEQLMSICDGNSKFFNEESSSPGALTTKEEREKEKKEKNAKKKRK